MTFIRKYVFIPRNYDFYAVTSLYHAIMIFFAITSSYLAILIGFFRNYEFILQLFFHN